MRMLIATMTLLALAACQNRGESNGRGAAPAVNNAAASDSMIGSAPPTAATPPPATRADGTGEDSPLVGRWGEDGQCQQITELFGNGTYRAANGYRGHWRLEGDRLTLTTNNVISTFRIISLDANRAVVEDQNGNREESVRC